MRMSVALLFQVGYYQAAVKVDTHYPYSESILRYESRRGK
jgi:hypothetical protein